MMTTVITKHILAANLLNDRYPTQRELDCYETMLRGALETEYPGAEINLLVQHHAQGCPPTTMAESDGVDIGEAVDYLANQTWECWLETAVGLPPETTEFLGAFERFNDDDDDYCVHLAVEVNVDDETYEVGVWVGIPDYHRSTAKAAGGPTDGLINTWHDGYGDMVDVPEHLRDAVKACIAEHTLELWHANQNDNDDDEL